MVLVKECSGNNYQKGHSMLRWVTWAQGCSHDSALGTTRTATRTGSGYQASKIVGEMRAYEDFGDIFADDFGRRFIHLSHDRHGVHLGNLVVVLVVVARGNGPRPHERNTRQTCVRVRC